jgi:hypothetical protein
VVDSCVLAYLFCDVILVSFAQLHSQVKLRCSLDFCAFICTIILLALIYSQSNVQSILFVFSFGIYLLWLKVSVRDF